jgi:hypothetical protein
VPGNPNLQNKHGTPAEHAAYMRDWRKRKRAERRAALAAGEPDPGRVDPGQPERQRRSDARKKARQEAADAAGIALPAPQPGSHLFQPGNSLAVAHGAMDPARFAEAADALMAARLAGDAWPDYLKDPLWHPQLHELCVTEARIALVTRWLSEQDLLAGMTEVTKSEETEQGLGEGTTTRRAEIRHMTGAAAMLDGLAKLALRQRVELGLTPRSRAALGKDLTATNAGLTAIWAEMDAAEARKASAPPEGPGAGGGDTAGDSAG